jgi:hypothetical protein
MLKSINTLVCIPLQHEKTTKGVANRTLPFQQKATREKYTIAMSRFYGNRVTILIQIKLERNNLCLNNINDPTLNLLGVYGKAQTHHGDLSSYILEAPNFFYKKVYFFL